MGWRQRTFLNVSTKEHTKRVDIPNNTLHEDLTLNKGTYRVKSTLDPKREREKKKHSPSVAGVNKENIKLVLGLFPSNTLLLINTSLELRLSVEGKSACLYPKPPILLAMERRYQLGSEFMGITRVPTPLW